MKSRSRQKSQAPEQTLPAPTESAAPETEQARSPSWASKAQSSVGNAAIVEGIRDSAPSAAGPQGDGGGFASSNPAGGAAGGGSSSPAGSGSSDPSGTLRGFTSRLGVPGYGPVVHDGEEGQAGASAGAAATTRGNDVFLGAGFGQLSAQRQDFTLAHEAAHVAQASSGNLGGATPTGDQVAIEADANQTAQALVGGAQASVQLAIPSGSEHDLSFSDIGDAINDTIDSVLEWGIDQIESVQDLISYIAKVGEGPAKKLIDLVIKHKVEIIVSFLTLNPTSALVVYILKQLPMERIQAFLESIDYKTIAKVVALVVGAGAIAVIAAPLMAMGAGLLPILKELSPPILIALWRYAPDEMKALLTDYLVETWPLGLGMDFEGGIGITFGYPIYVGADAYCSVAHFPDKGKFTLKRGGILTEAFDTGVGAGGFVGIGKGKKGDQEGGLGIGAEAGAEFQAGVKQAIHQEFEFPVSEDDAFMSFLLTALGSDMGTAMSIMRFFPGMLGNIDPMSYNTKTRFEFKTFAEGNAGAGAGLRTGGKDTKEGSSTWDNKEGKQDTGQTKWWQRWLQASIAGRLAIECSLGVETETKEFTQDADGKRIPAKMDVSVYGEGAAAASIVHKVPVISQALPQVPTFDGGLGIKATWSLSGGPTDQDPKESSPTWKFYGKTGSMDRYSGAASETTLAMSTPSAESFESLEKFLATIQGVEFKRRFSLGTTLGRKYANIAARQKAFSTMLDPKYQAWGFRLEGYLDLEATITADQVRAIFQNIANIVKEYQKGGAPLMKLYTDVMTLFTTGKAPKEVMSQLEEAANHILSGLKKLQLHGLVGLSMAAGGKVSVGAKLRVQGNMGGQITLDVDLLKTVGGSVTIDEIKELLQGKLPSSAGEVTIPGTDSEPTA